MFESAVYGIKEALSEGDTEQTSSINQTWPWNRPTASEMLRLPGKNVTCSNMPLTVCLALLLWLWDNPLKKKSVKGTTFNKMLSLFFREDWAPNQYGEIKAWSQLSATVKFTLRLLEELPANALASNKLVAQVSITRRPCRFRIRISWNESKVVQANKLANWQLVKKRKKNVKKIQVQQHQCAEAKGNE